MSDSPTTAEFPFDRWSLYLFVTGLLGPFVVGLAGTAIVAFSSNPPRNFEPGLLAVWFGVIAQLLAFVFGILGRQSTIGGVGLFGSIVVLAGFVFLAGFNVTVGGPGR